MKELTFENTTNAKERENLLNTKVLEPLEKIKNLLLSADNQDDLELILKDFSEDVFIKFIQDKNPEEIKNIVSVVQEILLRSKSSHFFYEKMISLSIEYFDIIEETLKKNFHQFHNADFINNILGSKSLQENPHIEKKIFDAIENFKEYYKNATTWKEKYAKFVHLTNFILNKGPEEISTWIKEEIKNEIYKENYKSIPSFTNFTNKGSFELEKVFEETIFIYTQNNFRFSKKDFFNSGHYNKEISWSENLKVMREIENEISGGVKELIKDYGIREFNRYPVEILTNQLSQKNIDRPFGVLMFPYCDHNEEFDKFKTIIGNFYEKDKTEHSIKIFEIGSNQDLLKYLIKLRRDYPKNQISYLILGGHGNMEGIEFTDEIVSYATNIKDNKLTKDVLENREKTLKFISSFFVPEATIVLISCFTGAEKGFGFELSQKTNIRVMGPEKEGSLRDLHFENGKLEAVYSVPKKVFEKK